jgi:hypothetical protein
MKTGRVFLFGFLILVTVAAPAFSQTAQTGTITGRAMDGSGGLIPGVEVTINSPAMIGGARNVPTDETGSYRFTLLPPGTYRVSFALPGFKTLNIDGVTVNAAATMTINGTMEVASVAEEVTVTSQAPTIDLEAATVGVNWGKGNLDDLPWGRSVVALAGMIPGMRVTTYDVGGNQMGGSSTLSGRVYGRAGGETRTYDGIAWCMGFDDFGSYEEIQLSAAAKGAEAQNTGVTANYVIKSGGNEFHSSAYAAWEDSSFQSNNVDQALLEKHFAPSANNFTRYNDFDFDLGGPIIHNKFWFYGSYNDTYTGQHIAGFITEKTGEPATYIVHLKIPTLKLTYQLNDKMKLEATAQYSLKLAPYRTGSAFVPLEATQNQKSLTGLGPALKWTYIMSPKMTSEFNFNRGGYWWPTIPHTTDIRKVDITTSQTRGAYLQNYREPIRWQWNGAWSYFPEIGGKGNEIKTGFLGWWDKNIVRNDGYPNQQQYRYRSTTAEANAGQYFLNPDSVIVYDYPNLTASVVNYESWYVNDKIKVSRKLTVNAGLRYDHYTSYLPEQGNPGLGPFATKNIIPRRTGFPVYHSWAPRLSFAYDVMGDGRIALKASYGRYAGAGSSPGSSPGPTGNNVNQAATRSCTYSNWNGTIPYAVNPGPDGIPLTADDLNLSGSCGGGGGSQQLDSNLKSPYLDEYTAGIEWGISRDYLLGFTAVRKFDKGGNKTLDLAQPYDAYTDIRCGVDRGRDNTAGTADDGQVCVWSVPRTYPTFGQINTLRTQYADGEGTKNYTAFELTFQKQRSNKWSALAGYTADFSHISNAQPLNPNQAAYNWQIPEWYQSVKLNGTYDLPYGLKFASVYNVQQGAWYSRTERIKNALNSTVNVVAEGHFGRYPWVKLWDNRVSKTFQIGDKQTIEGMFDLYNTLNANTLLSQVTTNGPTFLYPTAAASGATSATPILPARIFKLGIRYRF